MKGKSSRWLVGVIQCFLVFPVLGLAAEIDCDDLDKKVRELIHEVAIPNPEPGKYEMYQGKQARIFEQLEKLGKVAVPAIVKYMDDRRQLPFGYIRLANKSPTAFEASRQYTPHLVIDALAAILNQLSGVSFEFIYSGRTATDAARDREVVAWKKFVEASKSTFECQKAYDAPESK